MNKSDPSLHILIEPYKLYTLHYPPSTTFPQDIWSNPSYPFFSILKSPGEITVIAGIVPTLSSSSSPRSSSSEDTLRDKKELIEALGKEPDHEEGPWRALRIRGPLDLSLTGILNTLTEPLKHAKVPIFALSTWNTDYVLIPSDRLSQAETALTADGWTVQHQPS